MKLTAEATAEINRTLEKKRIVHCTTFDYAKTIELWADNDLKARFRSLAEAKRYADAFQKRNPSAYVKVVEIKKKVHEFSIKGST